MGEPAGCCAKGLRPRGRGNGVLLFFGLIFFNLVLRAEGQPSWDSLSRVVSLLDPTQNAGSTNPQLVVQGSSLASAAGEYMCVWTLDTSSFMPCESGMMPSPSMVVNVSVSNVALVPSDSPGQVIRCTLPAWSDFQAAGAPSGGGRTYFKVVTAAGMTVPATDANYTFFYYLDSIAWDSSTPVAGTPPIYEEILNCGENEVPLKVTGGPAPIRYTVEYQPMMPLDKESFVASEGSTPDLNEIRRRTIELETKTLMDAFNADQNLGGGAYCSNNASTYNLRIPDPEMPEMKKMAKDGSSLMIGDNTMTPADLSIDMSACDLSGSPGVCSTMTWTVRRGWEGFAYYLCVRPVYTAIPMWAIPDSEIDDFYPAKQCFYFVVPKCQRCFGNGDTLGSIAADYGVSWRDLWSMNQELVNTTAPNPATDERWGVTEDLVYPLIEDGYKIRLGIGFVVGDDSLNSLARRYGVSLGDIMSLNPDLSSTNQDSTLVGKSICLAVSGAKYSQCPVLEEPANPLYFEEITSYGPTGVPIKQPNARYPYGPNSYRPTP